MVARLPLMLEHFFTGAKMSALIVPSKMDKALQLISQPQSCKSHIDLKVSLLTIKKHQ
jgi:hypothetical protein